MEKITTIAVWQTVFKDSEISIEGLRFCNEEALPQRKLKRRNAKSIDQPILVVLESAEFVIGRQREYANNPIMVFYDQTVYYFHDFL